MIYKYPDLIQNQEVTFMGKGFDNQLSNNILSYES